MKPRSSALAKNLLVVGIATLIPLGLIFAFNAYLGSRKSLDLVFPAHSKMLYETFEFTAHVNVNGLGFRDREFTVERGARDRIVALGDSFTFGWGVEAEESWPKRLEEALRKSGKDVEVANLGRPGMGAYELAEIGERAIPVLKPTLVLVGISQGDGLIKMRETDVFRDTGRFRTLRNFVNLFVGNIRAEIANRKLEKASNQGTSLVREEWKGGAYFVLKGLTPEQKKRYETIDPKLREHFEKGELNPGLMQQVVTTSPDRITSTLDLGKPETQELISRMAFDLQRIRKSAETVGAKVLFVSVPEGMFTRPDALSVWREVYGHDLPKEMLTGTAQDDGIRLVAERVGVPLETATAQFRADSGQPPLYFKYDGHLSARGHQLLAESIAPRVASLLNSR